MGRTYNVIDSDGHVLEPQHFWREYIDPQYRDRAPDQVDPVAARPLRHGVDRLAAVQALGQVAQARAVQPGVPLLGQEHDVCAAIGRVGDQRRHVADVVLLARAGRELDAGGAKHAHRCKPSP